MEGRPAAPRPSFHVPCQGHMAYFWKGCEQSAQAWGWTALPKDSGVDGLGLHGAEDLKIQEKQEPQPPVVPSACACQCEVGAPQPGLPQPPCLPPAAEGLLLALKQWKSTESGLSKTFSAFLQQSKWPHPVSDVMQQ